MNGADLTLPSRDTTSDALFRGRVALVQPARDCGYRVNVDALLLAAFAAGTLGDAEPRAAKSIRTAFDLGSGVGAVGLALLHLKAAEHVTMIEIDPTLARLAEANALANAWTARVSVVCGDVAIAGRAYPGAADLVVCNPPYVAPGRGRTPSPERARAKTGPLGAFLDAARCVAGRRARVSFVYPAIEATTLLAELRARGLEPKRLRPVHGRPQGQARVVLVECAAGRPGGLTIEPPFVETDGHGGRSPALDALLAS